MKFRSHSEQQHRPAEDASKLVGESDLRPADYGSEEEHYVDLGRMVTELSRDHGQLRAFIYEFARVRLRKDLYPRFVEGAWFEIEEQMGRLERAIDRIEANFAQNALPGQFNDQIAPPQGMPDRPDAQHGPRSRTRLSHMAQHDLVKVALNPDRFLLGGRLAFLC